MKIIVQPRVPQAAAWRNWAQQRAQFVLRRMRDWVMSAQVRLSDDNGPRGGADKRCDIELQTEHHGTLVASAVGRDWGQAINAALRKLARHLSRVHHRPHTQARLAVAHARLAQHL